MQKLHIRFGDLAFVLGHKRNYLRPIGMKRANAHEPRVPDMATFESTRPAPFGSIAVFRAVSAFQAAVEALTAWNSSRKTRVALRDLSDEVLADIGLNRGDITKL